MKKLLLLSMVLGILFLAVSVQAATLNFSWTIPAGENWTSVRIYERTGAAAPYTYTKIAEVACPGCTSVSANVSDASHTWIARSWNGQAESVDSTTATWSIPKPPSTFTVTGTLTLTPTQ